MTPEDLEWHTWPIVPRGGQHVGMSCGVLLVHKPTGIAVVCDDERSQMKNREQATTRLTALLGIAYTASLVVPADPEADEASNT